jgi:hypothetical protein
MGMGAEIAASPVSYDVPLGNPVYSYLGMIAFPGQVGEISIASRPFSEAQVCTLLTYAARTRLITDTAINNFYLRQFMREGDDNHAVRQMPGRVFFDGWNTWLCPYFSTAFASQDSNFSIAGVTAQGVDSLSRRTELYNKSTLGARLYSTVGGAAVYVDGSIITEASSFREWIKTDSPAIGENFSEILSKRGQPSHLMGYDDFTAYLKLPTPWFDCKIGNDRVSWGYDDSEGLLFSGVGKPFLQIKLDRTFGKLNYSFVIGKLIADTYDENKVVYAKHITYTPSQAFSVGYSDAEITVNRPFVPLYCMPFLPAYFAGHYLGDPDNLLMSFDAQSRFSSRCAAYGELIIDDMSDLTGFFTNNDFGDKWGGIFGVKVFNPLPWLPLSLFRAEILQIEPWVFTTSSQTEQVLNRTYPVNFGELLGNQLGPHSRQITLDLSGRFSAMFGGGLAVRQIWKGEGPGSSIYDLYNSSPTFMDTLSDGTVINAADLADKSYRFEVFDRDRTVLSATLFADPYPWLRLNANLDLARELKPVAVNLYQAGAGLQFNY